MALKVGGVAKYMLNMDTMEVYDMESYEFTKKNPEAFPVVIGKLITDKKTGVQTVQLY